MTARSLTCNTHHRRRAGARKATSEGNWDSGYPNPLSARAMGIFRIPTLIGRRLYRLIEAHRGRPLRPSGSDPGRRGHFGLATADLMHEACNALEVFVGEILSEVADKVR
jgi:hypothetical protein